jgi:hypothetical protein
MSSASIENSISSGQHKMSESIATVDLGVNNNFRLAGMPPQMNFAHLVLTNHFQKCVLSIESQQQRTGWNFIPRK